MRPRQFHALLFDERGQQFIQWPHDVRRAAHLEQAVFFDGADALVLDVAGHDTGERPPQVGGKPVPRLVPVQLQVAHVFMRRQERRLELLLDLQQPVEIIGIIAVLAEMAHRRDALLDLACDTHRVVDDYPVTRLRRLTQGGGDKAVDLPEAFAGDVVLLADPLGVWSVVMSMPKRMRSTFASRGVSPSSTECMVSLRDSEVADSIGDSTEVSSMKSPGRESSSSPHGRLHQEIVVQRPRNLGDRPVPISQWGRAPAGKHGNRESAPVR